MIRRTSLLAAKFALVLAAVMLIALGAAWWRLSAGPLQLPALTRQIEAQLSAARGGRAVDIASVQLSWSGEPRALQLQAHDIRILDGEGAVISRYSDASIGLSVLQLMIGRIALVRAEFIGGDISVTRKREGETHIAFGPPGSTPDVIIPASEDDDPLAEKVRRVLDGLARAFQPIGPGGPLRDITIRGARLEIIDEMGGGRWLAENAVVALNRTRGALVLAVDAELEGAGAVEGNAPANLRITTDTRFQEALIEFGARDARPRAVLSPAMLGIFAGLDAPMTAQITIGLDRERGVNQFEGALSLGRGGAVMAGQRFSLDGGRLHGRYELETDELVIDQVSLAGSRTRISGEARLANASSLLRTAPDAAAAFDLTLPSATLDVPGVFEEAFDLQRVRATGEIRDGVINLSRLEAQRGEARLEATGRVRFAALGAERKLYPGIQLDGRITGALDPRTVLALWPKPFVEGARTYLSDALVGGRITDVAVRMDIPPEEIAGRQLGDRSLELSFGFTDGIIRYINTMSPITAARGTATLRGNSFNMAVSDARLDGLVISEGRVEMPRLNPKGEMVTIRARADGDARALIGLLMQEPISLGPRLPLEPATIGGRGSASLVLQRPNQANVPFEDIDFTVDGRFENVSGTMRENRLALTEGRLRVSGNQDAITISGPMRLGASQVEVAWTERLTTQTNPSRYRIAGTFDADDLETLGYPARLATRGRIGVEVTGEGTGFQIATAQVGLNLTPATAFLPRNFWVKRPGTAANARFNVSRAQDGGYVLTDIDVQGAGLATRGRVALAANGMLREVDLPSFTVDGRANLAITGRRGSDGALEFTARGPMIDAAPFLDVVEEEHAPPRRPVAAPSPAAGSVQASATPAAPPVETYRIALRADRMELRGGVVMTNTTSDLVLVDTTLQTLVTHGTTGQGRTLDLALGPRASDPQGRVAFRADDAGFAWRGFTGADNIIGGTATATGTWRMGPPSVAQINLRMRDFRVVNVPAMAHLLGSVASLTGFVEMLNGEGIGFSSLDAPVTLNADNLVFTQARMAGPSLGLTASGSYDMNGDDLDVDGVVVPSYGLNSVLGNVPLLGNLLTSRRGEGVFGMTYAVNGPVAAPRVGVNPLSALTPGILRRIFEPIAPRRTPAPARAPATGSAAAPASGG